MAQRRRKKEKRHERRRRQPARAQAESPEAPPVQLVADLVAAARDRSESFEANLRALLEFLPGYDPIHLLSLFAFYGHVRIPRDVPAPEDPDHLGQSDVELVQALVLRFPQDTFTTTIADPGAFHQAHDLLKACTRSFQARQWMATFTPVPEEDTFRVEILGRIRSFTQAVRNWSSGEEMIAIIEEIVAPLDSLVEQKAGIRPSRLARLFYSFLEASETRVARHFDALRSTQAPHALEDILEAFVRAFPDLADSVRAAWPTELLRAHPDERESFQEHLFYFAERAYPRIFRFTLDDLAGAYGDLAAKPALHRVMDAHSVAFGELADGNPNYLFLDNPVWTRPFIKLADEVWFCPAFITPLSFCLDIIEDVCQAAGVKEQYHERRAGFLEDAIYHLFCEAFPGARIHRNVQWVEPDSGTRYESDVVLQFGEWLLLIEAKSRRIDDRTRRGAPTQLKRDVREMIEEPAIQSRRFRDFLLANRCVHTLPTDDGGTAVIDSTRIAHIFRLSVSLDHLGDLQTRWPWLQQAGLQRPDVDPAPTIPYSSLKLLFDLLEEPDAKLHYLVCRAEFEHRVNYLGDELDVIGAYLENALNVEDVPLRDGILFLEGRSDALVRQYLSRANPSREHKPSRPFTSFWRTLIRRLEADQPASWLPMVFVLRDIASRDQNAFERNYRTVCRKVAQRRTGYDLGHAETISGPRSHRVGVLGIAYRTSCVRDPETELRALVQDIAATHSAQYLVVLVRDMDRPQQPYNRVFSSGTPRA